MEHLQLRKILSRNIKDARTALHISQEKLAELTELSSQTINDIEGCRMWVSDKTLVKLAAILHLEPSQLLSSSPTIVPPSICAINDTILLLKGQVNSQIDRLFDETSQKLLKNQEFVK